MRKILFCLIALVIVFTASGCFSGSKYKEYIEELNKELPINNGNIRLDKMSVEDNAFKCYYTILIDVPQLPTEEEIAGMKKMLIERVKADESFKVFRDDKLDFYFLYLKKDGSKIWEVELTPEDYQ